MGGPAAGHAVSGRRSWRVALVAVAAFVAAGVLVAVGLPRGGSIRQQSIVPIAPTGPASRPSAAVDLLLSMDAVDPSVGLRLRMLAVPGPSLPAGGATVFSSLGAAPYIVVRPGQIDQERAGVVSFASGDLGDYPFDAYRAVIDLAVLPGTKTTYDKADRRAVLPVLIHAATSAAGVVITATTRVLPDDVLSVTVHIRRTASTVGWVLAMMAIYWALAILAACATYMVVRRRRTWETRLLAWLSAMVFALIAFRTAAPGAPPVGTFLDFYAVFEAVGLVAVSLVVLMIVYLVAPPERFGG